MWLPPTSRIRPRGGSCSTPPRTPFPPRPAAGPHGARRDGPLDTALRILQSKYPLFSSPAPGCKLGPSQHGGTEVRGSPGVEHDEARIVDARVGVDVGPPL